MPARGLLQPSAPASTTGTDPSFSPSAGRLRWLRLKCRVTRYQAIRASKASLGMDRSEFNWWRLDRGTRFVRCNLRPASRRLPLPSGKSPDSSLCYLDIRPDESRDRAAPGALVVAYFRGCFREVVSFPPTFRVRVGAVGFFLPFVLSFAGSTRDQANAVTIHVRVASGFFCQPAGTTT
jgi:hypothetical protein